MILLKKQTPTFLFYDYETFGINTSLDKPAQFACIRTDIHFNIIEEPQCFYCIPSDDYLPDPHSILITSITPQHTQKNGTNECHFSKKIHFILTQPYTCIIGFNNINFDDEITRNIFYRNFFDPYEWSWKNNNSRWDLLNLLRTCYALRPNGIKWPINKLGLPSFKLSDLTNINNIMHFNVHDAISDVYATIEIAKLIRRKQPKLFNFFFKIRHKHELYKLINLNKIKPMIYVSSVFGALRQNMTCILPITWHQKNKNILIAVDLFKDVKKLIFLCKEISFDSFCINDFFDLGIVLIYINRCPMLAPMKTIRAEDYNRLNLHLYAYNEKIDFIKKNPFFIKKIQIIFSKERISHKSFDVDSQIYDAFFDSHDKTIIKNIRETESVCLKQVVCNFHDIRLNTLFFRYRARNFFNTLDIHEKKRWLKHCFKILNPNSLQEYKNNINNLLQEYSSDQEKVILLKKVLDYVLEKYQSLYVRSINLN